MIDRKLVAFGKVTEIKDIRGGVAITFTNKEDTHSIRCWAYGEKRASFLKEKAATGEIIQVIGCEHEPLNASGKRSYGMKIYWAMAAEDTPVFSARERPLPWGTARGRHFLR